MTERDVPIVDLEKHRGPYVTVRLVAAHWGVSTKTIRRQIDRGKLPYLRLPGGGIRIKREDALSFGRPEE